MHNRAFIQSPGTPWSHATRTRVEILSFPTPSFRGPIYVLTMYQFNLHPSEFCLKIAPWDLASHPNENKVQAENKDIIKIGTTGAEEGKKAYCVTA